MTNTKNNEPCVFEKIGDKWCVTGPGHLVIPGSWVTVQRKDGTQRRVKLGSLYRDISGAYRATANVAK